MKDTLNEQLSALVDDELEAGEQAMLLRQLGRDESLRNKLARYQLVSDTLQNHLPDRVDPGFHQRIQDAISNEEIPVATPTGMRAASLFRPVAGLAVAASVAVMAVLTLQTVRETAPQPEAVVVSAPAPADYIRAEGKPVPRASRPVRDLDAYLFNHNAFSANRAMLPYMRIVGQADRPVKKEDVE